MADELRDLRINSDRQVYVADDGDLATTSGLDTVKQSVAISAGDVLRPLIGEPITGSALEEVRGELQTVLQRDPQIETVQRVEITDINKADGTVTVDVFTSYNNSFSLDILV